MNANINNASVAREDLNALVGSRICHDLISPLGAISNGVELLNMAGMTNAPELALIAESVESANARIRFFRVAFGAANRTASFSHGDATAILKDVYKTSRTSVTWQVQGDLTRAEVKLAFLLIQCLDSALPRGGNVRITRDGDIWRIKAIAERLRIDENLWARLSQPGPQSQIAASEVQFALVAPAAASIARRVSMSANDTSISLSF